MFSAFCFAYLPGESEFASLDGGHGVFGNPAAVPAFDSWGALADYQFDDGISTFRMGGNLDHLAAGFSYSRDGKGFDESRWSLSHGSEWLARSIFLGTRVEALRSAAFDGTQWLFSAGAMIRPLNAISLGYSGRNLLQGGPGEQKMVHDLGATVRVGNLVSVSYDVENFKRHRMLFELELYGTRVGFKLPVHDDTREYSQNRKKYFSHALQSLADCFGGLFVAGLFKEGEHVLLVGLNTGLVERIHAKGVGAYAACEFKEVKQGAKVEGINLLKANCHLRHAAVDVSELGAKLCHVVAMLHVLAGKEVKLVKVLFIGTNHNAALGFLNVENSLKHNAGAFLDELTHGVKVCGVIHAGGEDTLSVLAF